MVCIQMSQAYLSDERAVGARTAMRRFACSQSGDAFVEVFKVCR